VEKLRICLDYPHSLLQTLLGGGGSFSSGGPGKGMYSRLYTNLLNGNDYVESCSAFGSSYFETGLFGIYSTVAHGHLIDMLNLILQELISVCQSIEDIEFVRAKKPT